MASPSVQDFANTHVGEIAAALPGATAIFRKHKIDFCCGGGVSLAEAAKARNASLHDIEAALAELGVQFERVAPQETSALIDHILDRFHARHRAELPELIKLARRVEAVHKDHADAPRGLAAHLEHMLAELEAHMQREEQRLFPMMLSDGCAILAFPVGQMRLEHDDHAVAIRSLDVLAHGFVTPQGACRSWQALYAGCAKFVSDLMEHIHLENNVLFPRFERRPD